jgi:hypothetical protein
MTSSCLESHPRPACAPRIEPARSARPKVGRLDDHRAERSAFVRQLLDKAGVRPGYAVDDGPFEWERIKAGDPDVPTRPALLLAAISERQRWKADYDAAQLATTDPPQNRSATDDQAA